MGTIVDVYKQKKRDRRPAGYTFVLLLSRTPFLDLRGKESENSYVTLPCPRLNPLRNFNVPLSPSSRVTVIS